MTKQFIEISEFKEKFPNVCKRLISVDCSPTWEPLLMHMCAQLEAELQGFVPENNLCYYCAETPVSCSAMRHVYAPEVPSLEEVKSKLGTLRIHMSSTTDRIDEIIELAEIIAAETCEECGKLGSKCYSKKGWISILCGECSSI